MTMFDPNTLITKKLKKSAAQGNPKAIAQLHKAQAALAAQQGLQYTPPPVTPPLVPNVQIPEAGGAGPITLNPSGSSESEMAAEMKRRIVGAKSPPPTMPTTTTATPAPPLTAPFGGVETLIGGGGASSFLDPSSSMSSDQAPSLSPLVLIGGGLLLLWLVVR